MFPKKNKKRGFTLIEMLIVIVIIGILAAALIPRLSSARGRANDVARKADLAQVAAALVAYQIDHGTFPDCGGGCPLSDIETELVGAGMSGIPTDPNSSRVIENGIDGTPFPAGQYGYIPIRKRGIDGNGFVLMAATETEGGSNRVAGEGAPGTEITTTTEFSDVVPCRTFDEGSNSNDDNGNCGYVQGDDVLRYIYIY